MLNGLAPKPLRVHPAFHICMEVGSILIICTHLQDYAHITTVSSLDHKSETLAPLPPPLPDLFGWLISFPITQASAILYYSY